MDRHMHLLREVLGDTSFEADETEPKKSLKSSPGIVPNSPVSLLRTEYFIKLLLD